MKATSCLLKHHIDSKLRAKVRDEVQKGSDNQRRVLEKLVGKQIENLQEQQETIEATDHVGAPDLKLELSALVDCVSQHHDRIEVKQESHERKEGINHVVADIEVNYVVTIFHKTGDQQVDHEIDGETCDQSVEELIRLLLDTFCDKVP